jgi:hypothetical protein
MTSASIPGIHSRSNQYYPLLPDFFRLPLGHRGELRGFSPLPAHPIASQCGISARQLRAFAVALRGLRSVRQDEAVRLPMSMLLQHAASILFPWTYGPYGQRIPTGCWHTTGVTCGELFPPLASRRRRSFCSLGGWTAESKGHCASWSTRLLVRDGMIACPD